MDSLDTMSTYLRRIKSIDCVLYSLEPKGDKLIISLAKLAFYIDVPFLY